jgi:GntR family transcriptional regulator
MDGIVVRAKKIYPEETAATDADALDRHSPIPLYQQLSDVLSRQMKQGRMKPGDGLPSEYDLMHRYGVSRYVVRQTLASLARQGLIYTEHGRGSFVSFRRLEKTLSILQSYHKNMRDCGMPVDVQILCKELACPPPEVAAQLRLQPDQPTFHMERLAYHQQSPLNLLITDISLPKDQLDLLMGFSGGSLYAYLAETCQVNIHHAHSYLEVSFAGEQESRLLNLPRGSVLIQLVSQVFSPDNEPLEFTQVVYPASMFRFRFDSQAAAPENGQPLRWFP